MLTGAALSAVLGVIVTFKHGGVHSTLAVGSRAMATVGSRVMATVGSRAMATVARTSPTRHHRAVYARPYTEHADGSCTASHDIEPSVAFPSRPLARGFVPTTMSSSFVFGTQKSDCSFSPRLRLCVGRPARRGTGPFKFIIIMLSPTGLPLALCRHQDRVPIQVRERPRPPAGAPCNSGVIGAVTINGSL